MRNWKNYYTKKLINMQVIKMSCFTYNEAVCKTRLFPYSLFKVEKQVDREYLVMYNNEIVKVGVFGVFWRQYTLALHASDRERK